MTAQTRKELAARAGISTRTLQRWLEPHKACGKTYGRIEHVDILDTLDLAKHIQRHGSIFARLPEARTLKKNDYALHQRPTKKETAHPKWMRCFYYTCVHIWLLFLIFIKIIDLISLILGRVPVPLMIISSARFLAFWYQTL